MSPSPVTAAYRVGAGLARTLPRPVAAAGARSMALTAAAASPERRRIVERNLTRVHGPDYPGWRRRRDVAATFDSYARYYLDSFRLPSLSAEEVDAGFGHEGFHHITDAVDEGIGPILALPHLGGWEWAAFWLTQVNHLKVTAVAERIEPPELFEWFVSFRRRLGMEIVPLGPEAARACIRAIREVHVLCLLCDRDLHGDGVPVEFFGERTTLPAGPATLALRSGAPLLPTAVYFEPRGRCRGVVRPPLDVRREGRFRDDVARITQDLAHELEILIRRAPDQWHLMQPNWPSDYAVLGQTPPAGDR